jgi:pyruvate/2-oxoglutarate dehydrogenase complex dihydrolipoamide acyltransferase (E2) component
MKNYKLLALFAALLLVGSVSAQKFDDLYFNPERDKVFTEKYSADNQSTEKNYRAKDDERYYEEEEYDYYDNYDYYYSSRIRRFQRPMYGFNFYDPVYVDMFYYDPFLSPATTVLIYDNMYSFNGMYGMNRWNRWNSWGYAGLGGFGGFGGFSPWGMNSWYGLNRWNNFGPGFYGYNNFYNAGFGGGFYCPPTWGSGYVYNTVNDIRNNTVYGPRTSGTTHIPRTNDREIRREAPKDVTNTPRQGTVIPDRSIPTTLDGVTPRETARETPNTRARAHEDQRNATQNTTTVPRERSTQQDVNRTRQSTDTPRRNYEQPQQSRTRESQAPTRTYEQPRQSTPSRSSGIDRSSSNSNSSGSSSAPRSSSGSSRRGGGN